MSQNLFNSEAEKKLVLNVLKGMRKNDQKTVLRALNKTGMKFRKKKTGSSRKPSPYNNFVKQFSTKNKGKYNGTDLMKQAAKEWKSLLQEQKQKYKTTQTVIKRKNITKKQEDDFDL